MSCKKRDYIVFNELIDSQKDIVNRCRTKETYDYQSVLLLLNFHLLVETEEIKNIIKNEYIDAYRQIYVYKDIEDVLTILNRILDINIVVDNREILTSKWIIVGKIIFRKEYKLIRNDYHYLIEFLNEYTYSSYKEIS